MKISHVLAALISIPVGLLLTALIVWLFAIDIMTLEHLSGFPENFRIMDLITNGFAVLMFGGSTRAAYRVVMEIWFTQDLSVTHKSSIQADKMPLSQNPDE